jgi:PKD repeat protein
LSASDAANIRTAVKLMVYDSLIQWHVGEYDPKANFSYTDSSQQYILFTNTSSNATKFYWNFGDGDTSNAKHPIHLYKQPGKFQVMLISYICNSVDTLIKSITIGTSGIHKLYNSIDFSISPNPTITSLYINIHSGSNYSYKILNLLGQEILSGKLSDTPNQISVSSLSEGSYIFQLTENGVTIGQQKFVKVLE